MSAVLLTEPGVDTPKMKLKAVFPPLPPRAPKHGEEEVRAICRRVVGRMSSGPVILRLGRYVTRQDIEARKKSILGRIARQTR